MQNQPIIGAEKMRRLKTTVCAVVLPVVLAIILLTNNDTSFKSFFWYGVFPVAAGLLTIYILCGIIFYVVLKNKDFKITEFRAKLFGQKDKLIADYNKYHSRNTALAILGRLYLWSFVFITVTTGAAILSGLFKLFWIRESGEIFFFLLSGVAIYIHIKFCLTFFQKSEESISCAHMYLPRSEYPQIWDTAIAAKIKTGVTGDLAIIAVPGVNVGITALGKARVLLVGFEVIRLLNQAELYAVFLHEFGHAVDKSSGISRKRQKLASQFEYLSAKKKLFPAFLFIPIYATLSKNFSTFALLTSYMCEQRADKIITKPEDIQNFINAVAKMDLYNIWVYELPKQNFYSNETPPEDYFEITFQTFEAAYATNKQRWEYICLNQLEARIDTHPNLPERMKTFGRYEFSADFSKDPKLAAEIEKIRKEIWPFATENWEKTRKDEYLQYQETLLKWKDEDCVPVQHCAELANAYFGLCDYDSALKCYDMVLAEKPNHAQAVYRKGLILCDRYDNAGIDLLYQSISNTNIGEIAFMRLGMYLQYMGMAEKREQIRDGMYSQIDQNIDAKTTKKFKIKQHTLPTDLYNKICGSVRMENECFATTYLANKQIGTKDNNSLFLCLKQNVDEGRVISALQNIDAVISASGINITLYIFNEPSQMGKLAKMLMDYKF